MFNLQPPRHISTLPVATEPFDDSSDNLSAVAPRATIRGLGLEGREGPKTRHREKLRH